MLVHKPHLISCTATESLNPRHRRRPPIPKDPALKSTWSHRAWLAGGCTTLLCTLTKSILLSTSSHMWLNPVLAGLSGYIVSDLATGIYHWVIDNYGCPKTPFVGGQLQRAQGHHQWPWAIEQREIDNNLHVPAQGVMFGVLPVNLFCEDPVLLGFVGIFACCVMLSQQFHAWAHTPRSRLPPIVVAIQDGGVILSKSKHAGHHRAPYSNCYCIVSGVWNENLDNSRFFEAMEMMIFFRFGVRPRSWSEPNEEWMEH